MNDFTIVDTTAVEIGERFNISAANYASPLAFYERVADFLLGKKSYASEMLFILTLIEKFPPIYLENCYEKR